MPLKKLQFTPGINREVTSTTNNLGWYDSDKVRFRSGYPEKLVVGSGFPLTAF